MKAFFKHAITIFSIMFLVFLVLDYFNGKMDFVGNSLSRKLLFIFCIISIISENRPERENNSNADGKIRRMRNRKRFSKLFSQCMEMISMVCSRLAQMPKALWGIFLGASFAVFSLQQMIDYSAAYMVFTVLGSFGVGMVIGIRLMPRQISFIKNEKVINFIILLVSGLLIIAAYKQKGCLYAPVINEKMMERGLPEAVCFMLDFFHPRYYILSIPAVWFILSCVFRVCRNLVLDLFDGISQREKKMYFVITLALFVVVIIKYNAQPMWYLQYDNVYSIDSGWCFQSIYPQIGYYDIRHPLMSELTFPIWAVITGILQLIAPSNLIGVLSAVFMQWINIGMLILTGIMLRKITGNIVVFFAYLCSFPTLLFVLSFEKYQMCVFVLVLYLYGKFRKRAEADVFLILTAGLMPTNAVIAVLDFFDREPLKEKMKHIGKIVALGLAILVCFGRVHLIDLRQAFSEIASSHSRFGFSALSIPERINAVFSMIQSSFVALPSEAGERYLWLSVAEKISVLSILIVAIIVIGMILGRKEKIYNICSLWVLFAFVLFVALNWAPYETPLFAIIFSWAIIPLFVKGLDFMISKAKIKPMIAYGGIGVMMLAVNITVLMDIDRFFG